MEKRQSIMRNRRTSHFVHIANELARSNELSHAAKGLLLQMLSYPDDWVFSLKHLAKNSASGLHATRSAFNELQDKGYVTRELRRNESGYLLGYDYTVYDQPTVVRFMDDRSMDDREPHATNTEDTKTEETNNKIKDKDLKQRLVEKSEIDTALTLSATPTSETNQELLDIWNANCGVLPRTYKLNPKRAAALHRLRKELGDQTADMLRDATLQVASDDYWIQKGYGFDNLIRDGRVVEKAEKYAAYGTMTSSDRRMANTAMTIMRAISGRHAN